MLSCKRNRKAFHRKYNLLEHKKRVHSLLQPPALALCEDVRKSLLLNQLSEGEGEVEEGQQPRLQRLEMEMDDAELEGGSGSATSPERTEDDMDLDGGGHPLKAKLRELWIMRAELDEDISSIERALSIIIGGESP